MTTKTEKFNKFLKDKKIECFQKEDIKDEFQTTVFKSFMEIEGQNLPITVITDISIYTMVRVQVALKILKKRNTNKILEYINELNRKYKVFKYYVTEEGDLYIDSCIVSTNEDFNGELIYTVIDVIVKHLTEHYPIFMNKIWNEENDKKK